MMTLYQWISYGIGWFKYRITHLDQNKKDFFDICMHYEIGGDLNYLYGLWKKYFRKLSKGEKSSYYINPYGDVAKRFINEVVLKDCPTKIH